MASQALITAQLKDGASLLKASIKSIENSYRIFFFFFLQEAVI